MVPRVDRGVFQRVRVVRGGRRLDAVRRPDALDRGEDQPVEDAGGRLQDADHPVRGLGVLGPGAAQAVTAEKPVARNEAEPARRLDAEHRLVGRAP